MEVGAVLEVSKAKQLYELGRQAEQAGRLQEALKYYKQSAREDPQFREAFNNLGALYARARRPDLSIGFFRRALELGEDEAVYFNLGSEYFRLEQLNDSQSYLKKALKLNPRLLKAHILLAYLYEKVNQVEKAGIYFQNALKLDPLNRVATLGYGVLLSENGEEAKALALAEKYLLTHPDDVGLKDLRAGLNLKLGKFKESARDFAELTKTSKKFTNFTEHLSSARKAGQEDFDKVFGGIDDKIKERTKRLRAKIEKRKESLAQSDQAKEAPGPDSAPDEQKQDLKDMVDLSFLHLFNGDSEKAMKFLMQARKMKENQDKSGSNGKH